MQQNQVELQYLEMVEISQAAPLMGKTINSLLREGAAGQRLLYAAILPQDTALVSIPSDDAPKHVVHSARRTRFVVLSQDYCVELAVHGLVEVQRWYATLDDNHPLAWHLWNLTKPQTLGLDKVFVPEADVSQPSALGVMSGAERDKLLRQIGALALAVAEKGGRYVRGGKPNVSQIAQAAVEITDAMPDADTLGLKSTSLRTSIAEGLALLKK